MAKTKRRYQGEESDDGPQEHCIKGSASPKITNPTAVRFQALACPFFKKDPARHWDCASFKTTKISHVKQHTYRKHTRPHLCPICGTQFKEPRMCDIHLRTGCSRPRPFLDPDGITIDQRNALNKRPASKANVGSQWYAMFDIIFPGCDRPSSPYNSPVPAESEATYMKLREFIRSDEAVEAMLMSVSGSLSQDMNPEKRPYLREAVQKGLQDLVEVHKRARSESAIFTDLRDDDNASPTSFNSINSTPPVFIEADPDTSGLSQPPDGGVSNTSIDLPSVSLCSESWSAYSNLVGSNINPSAELQLELPQQNGPANFSTPNANPLAEFDENVIWVMQQGLTFQPAIPESGVEFTVPHRGPQLKATVLEYPTHDSADDRTS